MRLSYLQNHYKVSETEHGYSFITDSGVEYFLTFFEYPPIDDSLSTKIYMFNIDRTCRYGGQNDEKVRNTILLVLNDFFEKNDDALIALTDTLDDKQAARYRLFNYWFKKFSADRLEKLDVSFSDNGVTMYVSLMFKKSHLDADNLRKALFLLKENNFYF